MNSSTEIITNILGKPSIDARKQTTLELIQRYCRSAFLAISGSSSDSHISFDRFFGELRNCKQMLAISPEENKGEIKILDNFIGKYEKTVQGKDILEEKQILQEMTREIYAYFDYTPKAYELSTIISTTVANAYIQK